MLFYGLLTLIDSCLVLDASTRLFESCFFAVVHLVAGSELIDSLGPLFFYYLEVTLNLALELSLCTEALAGF